MNLFDILFMQKTGKIKPDADLFDIMFAKVTGAIGRLVTILGNPLSFLAKKAQTAQSTKVTLEPVQDLHGYDNPWPEGGRKNKFDKDSPNILSDKRIAISTGETYNSTGYSVSDYIPIELAERFALTISEGFTSYYAGYNANKQYISTPTNTWNSGTSKILSAEGYAYVRFDFKTSDIDTVQFEKGYASAYTPYSNICPISGRSSVEIKGRGKNLFDKTRVTTGYLDVDGNISSVQNTKVSDFMPVISGKTYYFGEWYIQRVARYTCYYDKNKNFIGSFAPDYRGEAIIIPNNVCYVRTSIRNEFVDTYQLELGSTATTYEPYAESNDVTISFGETVYGGTLDIESGVLTVDKYYFVFDTDTKIDNLNNAGSSGERLFCRYEITGAKALNSLKQNCSHFKNASVTTTSTEQGYYAYTSSNLAPNNTFLQFRYASLFTNVTECREYFKAQKNAGTPVQCVFTRAEPITIQLTPEQIQILKGQNNIWIEDEGAVMELGYMN